MVCGRIILLHFLVIYHVQGEGNVGGKKIIRKSSGWCNKINFS